ncbi:glutamate racemase [Desulfofarcimen acetoxidans DSM 771]|uniref:Glutamate racemase n=1 Tax=Desulfofarcimen acetoxidans (strain ATCC 49208 / DSM 771 / KCTC 5769 / VKM B-1644 / 5575) TaxID=485916 RepID=C8VX36_DESAS|nr:glutamate racemase [Desulfofarcimen acetoxidans]ACV62612.1 glutamate racemase [Desulfofarcimen acetoxidans DSM 771]
MIKPAAIGLFDSGVGGLSIMKEVRKLLPEEDLIYFADSAYCPYGIKTPEVIRARCFSICDFLLKEGVKLIVVASNTTSVAGLDLIRKHYRIPIVGVEPAIKPAAELSRNGKIGILATGVTINGERFSSLVERFGSNIEVFTQPCPGLVELVEEGKLDCPQTEALLHRYMDPMLVHGSDTIVLGCTHYPFLRSLVEKIAGPQITVIDTGEAVARQVSRIVNTLNQISTGKQGKEIFYTSGSTAKVTPIIQELWQDKSLTVKHIELNT